MILIKQYSVNSAASGDPSLSFVYMYVYLMNLSILILVLCEA